MKIRELKKAAIERLSQCWAESVVLNMLLLAVVAVYLMAGYLFFEILIYNNQISYNGDEYFSFVLNLDSWYLVGLAVRLFLLCIYVIPMRYGICWCYIQSIRRYVVPINCCFSSFQSKHMYFRCMLTETVVNLLKLVVLAPCIVLSVF